MELELGTLAPQRSRFCEREIDVGASGPAEEVARQGAVGLLAGSRHDPCSVQVLQALPLEVGGIDVNGAKGLGVGMSVRVKGGDGVAHQVYANQLRVSRAGWARIPPILVQVRVDVDWEPITPGDDGIQTPAFGEPFGR